MHDPLNAIRRLYGEPGTTAPEELSPEGEAELRVMADIKAALDALPPRSPEASVVDAVVAAAGEAARSTALGPVRAVYGVDEAAFDAADAEARALAEVKTGLDALPPRSPEASLIDAVVAAAGEAARTAALAPIRSVYDEGAEPLATETAEAEAAALSSMKTALDALPPRRPDPSVIDAVVAAAAAPSARPATVAAAAGRAADRPARGSETRRRVTAVLGAVFAVVLVFAGGLWINQDAPMLQEAAVADRAESESQVAEPQGMEDLVAEAPGAAPVVEESEPIAPTVADNASSFADEGLIAAAPSPARSAARSASAVAPESEEMFERLDADAVIAPQAFAAGANADDVRLANAEVLARESDDELRLLYLRVQEMQAAQAGLGWDTPPVALGAVSDSALSAPASGWMQVRVER